MLPDSSIDLVIVAIVSVTDLQLYDDVRVVTVGGSDDVRHDFSGTSDVVVFVDVCFWPLPSIDTSTVSNVFVTVLQLFGLGVEDGEQRLLGISVVCTLVVVPATEPLESVTTTVSVTVFVLVTHDWL